MLLPRPALRTSIFPSPAGRMYRPRRVRSTGRLLSVYSVRLFRRRQSAAPRYSFVQRGRLLGMGRSGSFYLARRYRENGDRARGGITSFAGVGNPRTDLVPSVTRGPRYRRWRTRTPPKRFPIGTPLAGGQIQRPFRVRSRHGLTRIARYQRYKRVRSRPIRTLTR